MSDDSVNWPLVAATAFGVTLAVAAGVGADAAGLTGPVGLAVPLAVGIAVAIGIRRLYA